MQINVFSGFAVIYTLFEISIKKRLKSIKLLQERKNKLSNSNIIQST